MKIKTIIVLVSLFAISCSKPNPQEQKQHLSGYWEIKTVQMPDGDLKKFKANTVIDYMEVKGNSGMRTKVAPKFDGSFVNNGVVENFNIKIEDDSLRLYYKTPFDQWKETVIEAKDSLLKVKNRDNKIYTYSKFKKFDFK
jgi:hypothetical protein